MRILFLALLLVLLPGLAQAQRCPDQLPPLVVAKRDAIVTAAKARDWPALRGLMGPGYFMSANPNHDDPIAYWQQLTREGTDVPAALVAIFSMRCGITVESNASIYPIASAMGWRHLKKRERKALQKFYGDRLDAQFVGGRDNGHYIGWRGVIEKDGRWSAFLQGN
jgi:hypothetical protein